MTTTTHRPVRVTYELETLTGQELDDDTVDVSCFNQTVRFVRKGQPNVDLSTEVWNAWEKPRRIVVTIEPK